MPKYFALLTRVAAHSDLLFAYDEAFVGWQLILLDLISLNMSISTCTYTRHCVFM